MANSREFDQTLRISKVGLSATTGPDGLARATAHGFRFGGIHSAGFVGATGDHGPIWISTLDRSDFYARDLTDKNGNSVYRCDDQNPMVIVFIERGAAESHVMPSRGGYELTDGEWKRVEPSWPENPRPEVRYRPGAERPQSASDKGSSLHN